MAPRLLIKLCLLTVFAACGQMSDHSSKASSNSTFFKQVSELDEFKAEQKKADSIKRLSQIPPKLSVEIIDGSYFKEDSGKNISIAHIVEEYPYEGNRIIYTVKFDKNANKIISIAKNGSGVIMEPAVPADLPLPKK